MEAKQSMPLGEKIAIGVLIAGTVATILYFVLKPSKANATTLPGGKTTKPGQTGYVPGAKATPDSTPTPVIIGQVAYGTASDPYVQNLASNATLNMKDVLDNGGSQADGYRTWISSFYNTWSPYTAKMSDADATTMYSYLSQQYIQKQKPSNSLFNQSSAIVKKYGFPPDGTDFD